jgi:hypothetical protein
MMMKGINVVLHAPARMTKETPRRLQPHVHSLPWWLLIVPAALVTVILAVAALMFVVHSPSTSSDADGGGRHGPPVVDEIAVSETARSSPAFSR